MPIANLRFFYCNDADVRFNYEQTCTLLQKQINIFKIIKRIVLAAKFFLSTIENFCHRDPIYGQYVSCLVNRISFEQNHFSVYVTEKFVIEIISKYADVICYLDFLKLTNIFHSK